MIAVAAVLRKIWAEIKKSSEEFFQGEIVISKKECWLIGSILVLGGIAIGLVNAPLTHGININIGSNNSGNGCNNTGAEKIEEKTEKKEKTEKPEKTEGKRLRK